MQLLDMNDRPLSYELYTMVPLEIVKKLIFLMTGPNYIPTLLNTLLKFCTYPVVLVADIEKVFLMVGILQSDRDV